MSGAIVNLASLGTEQALMDSIGWRPYDINGGDGIAEMSTTVSAESVTDNL